MGLAGQCLVEAGVLPPVLEELHSHRRLLRDVASVLSGMRAGLTGGQGLTGVEKALGLIKSLSAAQGQTVAAVAGLSARLEMLSGRLYQQVLASRMRPFAEGVKAFPRLVRDLAKDLGKQAVVVVEGGLTPVDRDILEKLEAPLIHLARNAVDHGLESPERRAELGKPQTGRIVFSARHVAGSLEVRVSEDGAGIDLETLRAKVVERGLADPELARELCADELYNFIFLPGFTTSEQVSDVSGRGVGLDVVMTMVQAVGGRIRVVSALGRGTAFILRLPVTLSVVRSLMMTISGEPYAVPLSRIHRVCQVEESEISSLEGRQYLMLDGQSVGLVSAAQLLGLSETALPGQGTCVLVLNSPTGAYGLTVEDFLGERDLVIKPLDPRLGKVPNVAASALLEDGSPVLILDAEDLTGSAENLVLKGRLTRIGPARGEKTKTSGPKRILVVDDSLTVREVQRHLLAGRGYAVVTAVDGMDGLSAARSGEFDLIITDVDMPRLTGIELTRQVKADPGLGQTPVMIVSYKERDEDRLAGLKAGADYYLAKSGFRDQALLTAVADLIGEP